MKHEPEKIYDRRIESIDLRLNRLKKIELVLSLLKLAFVIAGVILLLKIALSYTFWALISFLFFLTLFILAALVHEHFIKQRNLQSTLREINADEIRACGGIFLDYDDGHDLDDPGHEYSSDLDIFGKRGLFHFVNRTTTSLGKRVLSDWLKVFPNKEEIEILVKKQEAVSELSVKIDFRHSIQAYGKGIDDSSEKLKSVKDFFEEHDAVLNRKLLVGFIHCFPLGTLAFIILIFFGWSWLFALGMVLIQGIVNRIHNKAIQRIYVLTAKNYKNLSVYSKVIRAIENESFESAQLDMLRSHFFIKNKPASFYIKKLASRFQYFEARSSAMIHFFMNNVFFWDLHCIYRIEKWKRDISPEIDAWFDSIGYFDALSSLGNMSFNHPDWSQPEFRVGAFHLSAEAVGHPLIPPSERVVNSVELNGVTNIAIVTGPNMAGKTTFLKTIGVNIVLALSGAPVCAKRFELSPLKLYTSMKVSDSLDKGLSLFYAELQRLKIILDAIARKDPVFFLIDEMLKGTNELDRHKGAIALVCQLIEQEAQGMLATHDLELTKLGEKYPGIVHNYHFDGYIEGDKLLFDYKLKEGICTSSNALELMKRIGIKVG